MGKVTTYLIIMTGLMILFHLAGLIENTPNSALMRLLLDPTSFNVSDFYSQILLIFGGIGLATGIVVGWVTKNIKFAVIAPFGLYLITLMWDFFAIYLAVAEANKVIALLFFSPLIVLWAIAIIEWVGSIT